MKTVTTTMTKVVTAQINSLNYNAADGDHDDDNEENCDLLEKFDWKTLHGTPHRTTTVAIKVFTVYSFNTHTQCCSRHGKT